jgi:hypothetical protein
METGFKMILDAVRFERAIARFDALNRQDPSMEDAEGKAYPKEFLYSERMSAMLKRYAPDASEALQLAARCQHIQRWKIARASYPITKAGYYQWRSELKSFHADIARQVLVDVGYEEATVERVCALVRKALPTVDAEAQILEDVVVLVFLESYLEQFVASHADYDAAKFADILNKTLRKTSAKARSAAQTMITLPAGLRSLVVSLLIQFDVS